MTATSLLAWYPTSMVTSLRLAGLGLRASRSCVLFVGCHNQTGQVLSCRRPRGGCMPTRDIKESCRTSRTLAKVSAQAERLFWRLTTYADDFGRFPADADVVRANCFSVMLDTVRENHVTNWLMELSGVDLIRFYTGSDGKTYGFFPTWAKHQRTRAKHSKYPAPSSADICRQMPADVAVVTESTEVPEVAVKTETPENISRGADAPPRGIEAQVLEWLNHKAGKNFRP